MGWKPCPLILEKYSADSEVGRVGHYPVAKLGVCDRQYRSGGQGCLDRIEGRHLLLSHVDRSTFLQHARQRQRFVGVVLHEPPVVIGQSKKRPEVVDVLRWRPRLDRLDLLKIHCYSVITDDMPKELYLGLPKLTLGNLRIQLVLTQAVKYRRYVTLVVLPRPAVDENVVQVDHDRLIQKWLKNFIPSAP